MNPFVASNNLYSLYITVTYETSPSEATYGDVIVGDRALQRQHSSLSYFSFFFSFCLIILIARDMLVFIPSCLAL